MLSLLFSFTNAQNVTAILNPGLSMQCQLAINSRITELKAFCLSPYDLKNMQASNVVDALINSFSFLPTVCSPDCKRALNSFGTIVGRTCKNEVLVNPKLGNSVVQSLSDFIQGLAVVGSPAISAQTPMNTPVPTTTTSNATLFKRQNQELPRALSEYFSNLNTKALITLIQSVLSVACVKDANTQKDAPNLLENKYCLKEQYATFSKVSDDKLSETIGTILNSLEVCNVCFQHQFFALGEFGKSIPVFDPLTPIFARINTGITQCPNLPTLDQTILISNGSSISKSFIGMFIISLLVHS
jgi:hypothetical protein